jgi:hypothetical protein
MCMKRTIAWASLTNILARNSKKKAKNIPGEMAERDEIACDSDASFEFEAPKFVDFFADAPNTATSEWFKRFHPELEPPVPFTYEPLLKTPSPKKVLALSSPARSIPKPKLVKSTSLTKLRVDPDA